MNGSPQEFEVGIWWNSFLTSRITDSSGDLLCGQPCVSTKNDLYGQQTKGLLEEGFSDGVAIYKTKSRSNNNTLTYKRYDTFAGKYFSLSDSVKEYSCRSEFTLKEKFIFKPKSNFDAQSAREIKLDERQYQDLDGDGFVDGFATYMIYSEGESINLRNKKGRTFSDESSSKWDAIKAVPSGSGYKILLKNASSKSKFRIWKANADGIIQKRSKWKSISQALKWESIFGDVINPDGIIGIPIITPSPDQEPLFNLQWHLKSAAEGGANVQQAWSQTTESGEPIYGTGVLIAIVDDGLQHDHEDLKANYDQSASYDFNFKDNDPSPSNTKIDGHGTSAAGVAAGVGLNGIGITGAAPNASLSGLRLLAGPFNDKTTARALVYSLNTVDIYSNSWGPSDHGAIHPLNPLLSSAFETGTTSGRDGKGSIYTWAGGNGRIRNDNSNYDGYANSRYVIAVAAIASNGIYADYSEPGANILISSPSDGGWHEPDSDLFFETPPGLAGITTTDLSGRWGYNNGRRLNQNGVPNLSDNNYTNDFGGTSSATPLTSGIIALMLQANALLSWRDVQHVLVNTASLVDSNSSGWITNGAGHHFNHDYGFGRIDADAAVTLAKSWNNVAAEVSYSNSDSPDSIIPDNSGSSLTRTISIPQDITIETVEIPLIAQHSRRGDLRITLQSPAGTTATLADYRNVWFDNNDYDFTFSAKAFWDESSRGDWTLTVTDQKKGRTGKLDAWGLNIFGTPGTNFNQKLGTTSSRIKRDAITGSDGAIFATSEALESIPDLASYLHHLDDTLSEKELINASSWVVGTPAGSKLKLNGDGLVKANEIDKLGGVTNDQYQIYEISSKDLFNNQGKQIALGSLVDRIDDQLAFAYPLIEQQQMSSRSALPDVNANQLV